MAIVDTQPPASIDKSAIADLIAQYGSSSTTAWLEFERYKIWRPDVPIPESDFVPVQGYMVKDEYVFAWGNPLVSSPAALPKTARAFVDFVEKQGLRPVWACVDRDLEEVLGSEEFNWSTVSCIYEDYVDPEHVIELTAPDAKGKEGQHAVKDLKKNLGRAEKYGVSVHEVRKEEWSDEDKKVVEDGIAEWKSSRSGVQIASTTLQPWLDQEHRRYWVARRDNEIIGILILTPIQANSWQIKNAVSFPNAPKGTSEVMIYTALKDLHHEQQEARSTPRSSERAPFSASEVADKLAPSTKPNSDQVSEVSSTVVEPPSSSSPSESSASSINGTFSPISATGATAPPLSGTPSPPSHNTSDNSSLRDKDRVVVTFGISASSELEPVHNLGGWKVKALSKTYSKVAGSAKLVNRGEFRRKFVSEHDPMYVCYPPDGFGLDGVNALFKVLKK